MHVVYADDSAQKGKREGQGMLVALGAAAFEESHVKPFADDFYAIYDKHGIPHEVELKWSPDSRVDWFRAEGKTELLTPVRRAVLKAAVEHEVRIFASIWDKGAQLTMRGQPAEHWVIQFLFERVAMFLENADHRGMIVFDKPGGSHQDEDAWIEGTRYLTDLGTEYVKSTAIIAPILTAPSHHHPHLQLADLVVGATTAAFAGNKYGLALMKRLKPMFHTNYWGNSIGGSGVKLYPDHVCNLYHWVLGDEFVMRRSMGIPMPIDGLGWLYVASNGLPARRGKSAAS
ncbi:hypothetical protein GCM10022239_11690 [Leifsonia bigeumensis]|uniref:DUF3800 domain-containing protein n=1 Tax=Leifsonella bigeumensis TaxID=433643 RepID=A0ABP7FE81_9MICO